MDGEQRQGVGGRNVRIVLATRGMVSDVTHSVHKEEAKQGEKYRNDNWKNTQWKWEVKQIDWF